MRRLTIFALALVASTGAASARDAGSEAVPYCADLKRIADLAMARERFVSITGQPREGNFFETSIALAGWKDCSLYGPATYTCDSRELGTAQEAEKVQATTLHDIKTCLGPAWAEAKDRASSSYVVLHHAQRPVSITLSTDETETRAHIVRLIVFVRRN
jgi:hypothetical protein